MEASVDLTSPRVLFVDSGNLLRVDAPAALDGIIEEWPGLFGEELEPESLARALAALSRVHVDGETSLVVTLKTGPSRRLTLLDLADEFGVHAYVVSDDGADPNLTQPPATPGNTRVDLNIRGLIVAMHGRAEELLMHPSGETIGQPVLEAVHPDHYVEVIDAFSEVLASFTSTRILRIRMWSPEGRWRWTEIHLGGVQSNGEVICASIADIDDEILAREEVEHSERQFRLLAGSLPIGVFRREADEVSVNPAFRAALGIEQPESSDAGLPGDHNVEALGWSRLDNPAALAHLDELIVSVGQLTSDEPVSIESRVVGGDGHERTIRSRLLRDFDDATATIGTVEDITDETRRARHLAAQARVDPLTGLSNRTAVDEHLASLGELEVALVFIDLDGFKQINDHHGHAVGDSVLRTMARRLEAAARNGDMVARLGGDEFVIVALTGAGSAEPLAERVFEAVGQPIIEGAVTLSPSASLGVAVGPASDSDTLLRHADLAMYERKRSGAGGVTRADAATLGAALRRRTISRDLPAGIATGELSLHYQPLVCLETGAMEGAESLVRWEHPELGVLSPAEFLPIAENNGQIGRLGSWGRDRLFRDLARVAQPDRLGSEFTGGINLSARQLSEPDFIRGWFEALERFDVSPTQVVVEVTEGELIGGDTPAEAMLCELSAAGVRIAIDDFGTGFSSLAYLTQLPVDFLKLDRRYVADLVVSDRTTTVVAGLATICRELGVIMVGEGIETVAELDACRSVGLDVGQGYLFCRPTPIDLLVDAAKNMQSVATGANIHLTEL